MYRLHAENEVLEALSICNSGPFPFCDSIRLYLTRYSRNGDILSRRTVPDKSSPSLGYEYEFGENLWIKVGKGNTIFAFAGKNGSYLEELACWVRNIETGEEHLVQPAKLTSDRSSKRLSTVSVTSALISVTGDPGQVHTEEHHKKSFSTLDVPIPSSSLNVLPNALSHHSGQSYFESPELVLPSSLPSSPSLPISLGRLSMCSSNGESAGSDTARSPRDTKRKRLSGQQAALKHGDDVQRHAREQQQQQMKHKGYLA